MSRNKVLTINPSVSIFRGHDHAVGLFVQVVDNRYAASGKDKQGEGYVFEWDEVFGITTNLIGATDDDAKNDIQLERLAEKFSKELV